MPNDVVSRLTDTSKYTGSHAERFNEDGTGKGKAGREDMKKFDGNTGSTSRSADNLIAPSPEKSSRPVVSDKSKSTEKGKNIFFFTYGNKSEPAKTVMLRDDAAGTRVGKAVVDTANGMGMVGKAKAILDQNMKKVVTTDQDIKTIKMDIFEENGKYLVIEKAEFSTLKGNLAENKIPPGFKK